MGGGPSVMSGNTWKRLSAIRDERRQHIPVEREMSSVLLRKDYHFTPCAASISLWSGKLYSSPAFPVKPAPATVEEPKPTSPGKKEAPPPELEQKPKKKEIENKYNTEGGCRLVLGSKDGIVHLYESSTRELLDGGHVAKKMVLRGHVRSHEGQVHCVKLYDDCNYAASFGQDAKIVTYDMQRRRVQHEIATRHHGAILCGDISPDLKFMLSGGMDGHLFLWNLETREKLCTMGTRPKDKTRKHRAMHERVLDDAKPWEIGKAPWPGGKLHLGAVKCTAFVKETPTNRLISGGWDTKLLVWDLDSYASFTELDGHTGRITGCATSYETRYCCTVSEDKDVRIWDLQDKTCTKVVKGHKGKIFSCDVSSWAIYEPLLLTCGADGELNMWDMRRQEIRDALEGHYDSCLACAITEDGKCGISVSQDGLVRAWRTRSMLELHITYMVGEAGSGVYIEFKISVDPRDDVHSAKEQFRILTSTPIAYDKEGEPTYEVKDAKYRGLSPDEQAWTALVDGRKRILEKDDKRLETYGLADGNEVTVVRQMGHEERMRLQAEREETLKLAKGEVLYDEDDKTPQVSPTVIARQKELKKKEQLKKIGMKAGGVIDPEASFKKRQKGMMDFHRRKGGDLLEFGLEPPIDESELIEEDHRHPNQI